MADITNNIGNAFKRLGRYNEAISAYETCYQFSKKYDYRGALLASTANLGETNLLMGNFEEALLYQLATIKMQEEDGID